MASCRILSASTSVASWGLFFVLVSLARALVDPTNAPQNPLEDMSKAIKDNNYEELEKVAKLAEDEVAQGVSKTLKDENAQGVSKTLKETAKHDANTQHLVTGSGVVSLEGCKLTPGATDSDLLVQVRQCTEALETSAKNAEAQRGRSRSLNKAYMDQFETVYQTLAQLRNPEAMTTALMEDKQAAMQRLMQDCADVEAKIQKLRAPHSLATRSGSLISKHALVKRGLWNKAEIHAYMKSHPQRAYFSQLFHEGGFRSGMEVGVAAGRLSELFLQNMKDAGTAWSWHMVEPFPNAEYIARFPGAGGDKHAQATGGQSWDERNIGKNVGKHFYKYLSTDDAFVAQIADKSLDFLYLDGAHDYENVKKELLLLFSKVRPGGVLAGHDYCNYGEQALPCKGCQNIPACIPYTEFGVAHGKGSGRAANQAGVVKAVQEFLVETHPELELRHTTEDFTRESLAQDGMDYNLVITSTRNPSWFFVIPE